MWSMGESGGDSRAARAVADGKKKADLVPLQYIDQEY